MTLAALYEIDGERFSTLDEFYVEFSRQVIPEADWGRNLDALNDVLRGGFGTPPGGFRLRWKNAGLSRLRLGYAETVQQLELRLKSCHQSNRNAVHAELLQAMSGSGPTVFDWIVKIIRDHGSGGTQARDGVWLELLDLEEEPPN